MSADGVPDAFPLLPLLSSKRKVPLESRDERRRRLLTAQQNESDSHSRMRRESPSDTRALRKSSGRDSSAKRKSTSTAAVRVSSASRARKEKYKRSEEKKDALEQVCDYYTSLERSRLHTTSLSTSRNSRGKVQIGLSQSTDAFAAMSSEELTSMSLHSRYTTNTNTNTIATSTDSAVMLRKRKKSSPRGAGGKASAKRAVGTLSCYPTNSDAEGSHSLSNIAMVPLANQDGHSVEKPRAFGLRRRDDECDLLEEDEVMEDCSSPLTTNTGERNRQESVPSSRRGRSGASGPRILSPKEFPALGERVKATTKGRTTDEVVNVSLVDLDTFLEAQKQQKLKDNQEVEAGFFQSSSGGETATRGDPKSTRQPEKWPASDASSVSDTYAWKESSDSFQAPPPFFSSIDKDVVMSEIPTSESLVPYAKTTVDGDGVEFYTSVSNSSSTGSVASSPVGQSINVSGGSTSRAGQMISNRWNEIFQQCTQRLHDLNSETVTTFIAPSLEKSIAVYEELHSLAQNFAYTAATYGKVIITEHNLPDHLKTVKTARLGGQAGGMKYLVHDLVFKFAVDDKNIYEKNDDLAMKVAGHELRALDNLINCQVAGIYFPLISIVDFRGFRLLAVSCLPVDSFTLKVGSANGGRTVENADSLLRDKMEQACQLLNLKRHKVGLGGSSEIELSGPIDLEGHLGKDGRYYLLDFARLFPPDKVDPGKPNSYLYEHLRPELVKQYHTPLCSDACSQFVAKQPGAGEHKAEIEEAHSHLVTDTIPGFVDILYALQGRDADLFLSAPQHLILSIHRQGINLRYLGMIRSLMLEKENNPEFCWNKLLLVEMIARVIKSKLRKTLRDVSTVSEADEAQSKSLPSEVAYRREIVRFLNLYFGETQESKAIWCEEIPRAVLAKFRHALTEDEMRPGALLMSLFLPIGADPNMSRCMLFRRVYNMCGFECSPAALERFSMSPEAFQCPLPFNAIHITDIVVKVKHLTLLEHSSGMLLKLQALQHGTPNGTIAVHDDCTRRQLLMLSLECFERALECNPSNTSTLLECADTYHILGVLSRARTLYTLATDLNPNSGAIALRYAQFLLSVEEADEAEEQLLRAWELGVSSPGEVLIEYAELLAVFRKDLSGFHDMFDRLLIVMKPEELRARVAEIRNRYCVILTNCGRTTTAEALAWFSDRYGAHVYA